MGSGENLCDYVSQDQVIYTTDFRIENNSTTIIVIDGTMVASGNRYNIDVPPVGTADQDNREGLTGFILSAVIDQETQAAFAYACIDGNLSNVGMLRYFPVVSGSTIEVNYANIPELTCPLLGTGSVITFDQTAPQMVVLGGALSTNPNYSISGLSSQTRIEANGNPNPGTGQNNNPVNPGLIRTGGVD